VEQLNDGHRRLWIAPNATLLEHAIAAREEIRTASMHRQTHGGGGGGGGGDGDGDGEGGENVSAGGMGVQVDVVLAGLKRLINISGSGSASLNPEADHVQNISISGITFTQSAQTYVPSVGGPYEVPSDGDWSVLREGVRFPFKLVRT
jgi:hypothetical protein